MGRETAADAAPVAARAVTQAKATRRSSRSRPSQSMLDNVECTLFHSRELQGRKQAGGCTGSPSQKLAEGEEKKAADACHSRARPQQLRRLSALRSTGQAKQGTMHVHRCFLMAMN